VRASHELSRVGVSFDEANLMSHAALVQAASLWQRLGMPGVVRRGLRLPGSVGANSDAKVATVVLGMLRARTASMTWGAPRGCHRAAARGGEGPFHDRYLAALVSTYGHIRQLDIIARQLLLLC